MRILVSGGTGFLGDWVVGFLKKKECQLTLISRSRPDCLRADLASWDGNIDPEKLKGQFDVFLHMAGLYNLRAGELECQRNNVTATHNALVIAQKAQIPHFVHISTIAVVAGTGANVAETGPADTSRMFPDNYVFSKANAENMVRFWTSGQIRSKTILRPAILVGDSKEGKIQRIDGPYHTPEFLKILSDRLSFYRGPLWLPGSVENRLPMAPVDAVARAIADICEKIFSENWEGIKSLHLSPRLGPSAQDLYESAFEHLKINNPLKLTRVMPKNIVKPLAEWFAHIPREELDYLLSFPPIDTTETEKVLGKNWCPEFPSYRDAFWRGYEKFVSNR